MSKTGIALALYLAHVIAERRIDLDAPQQGEDEHDAEHQPEQAGRSPAPAMPSPRGREADAAEKNDQKDDDQNGAHGTLLYSDFNAR